MDEKSLLKFIYYSKKKEIDKEIDELLKIFQDYRFQELKEISSKGFWKENQKKLKNLFELSLTLLSIVPSSSFIERFFSVIGLVCTQKITKALDELTIMRSMLEYKNSKRASKYVGWIYKWEFSLKYEIEIIKIWN